MDTGQTADGVRAAQGPCTALSHCLSCLPDKQAPFFTWLLVEIAQPPGPRGPYVYQLQFLEAGSLVAQPVLVS